MMQSDLSQIEMTNLTIIDLDVAEMVETGAAYANGHEMFGASSYRSSGGMPRSSDPKEDKRLRTKARLRCAELRIIDLSRDYRMTQKLARLFESCGQEAPTALRASLAHIMINLTFARGEVSECEATLAQL